MDNGELLFEILYQKEIYTFCALSTKVPARVDNNGTENAAENIIK